MTMPLLMGLSAEGVTEIVVKGLAVAGAFLIGFVLTGFLAVGLDRCWFHRKSPGGIKRFARILGGVLAAVLAAMILFGSGGAGLLGGGSGTGSGPPDGSATSTHAASNADESPFAKTTTPPAPRPPAHSADVALRVTVLGGENVRNNRFYQLESEPTPKTFEDLKTALLTRKAADKRKLALLLQFPELEAPARDHQAVIQLDRWAEQNGFDVIRPAKR